jgi:hypothetical protein
MNDNLVLEMLHEIRSDMIDIKADLRDVKRRMTALEISLLTFAARRANQHAVLCSRMDRQIDRLDRIGLRLEHDRWRY